MSTIIKLQRYTPYVSLKTNKKVKYYLHRNALPFHNTIYYTPNTAVNEIALVSDVQVQDTQNMDLSHATLAAAPNVKLNDFELLIINNQVKKASIEPNSNTVEYQTCDGDIGYYNSDKPIDMTIIRLMQQHGVAVTYSNKFDLEKFLNLASIILTNSLFIVIAGIIIYTFFSQRNGGFSQLRGFTSPKPPISGETVNVKFADVAGLENAKLEVMEIVEFLKNPERFTRLGAKIPKGCLLSGGPGLGKTLLAKAIAGEANVPFFAVPASSFVELFVGVGSARVRSLFQEANKNSPCIIFIDEIDAIGRARTSNGGFGGNDEREQTINQLLTEMDGFNENGGIVVIAATNRPDILDPALVRPGRFDRMITLESPTLKDREAILHIHTKEKPLDADVNLHEIAKCTVGLSGAELANIANEASILAARRHADKINMSDFRNAIDRVLLGPEKKNAIISDYKKKVVAAHEAGHAIVGMEVGEYDEITKISIVPRGKTGGVTMFEQLPENAESGLYSKQYLENRLAVALGGRAAEEIVFGEQQITTGAYSDMELVQELARAMITTYGFSSKLGTANWSNKPGQLHSEYSNFTNQEIDMEVIDLTKKAYERAKLILMQNTRLFTEIARQLYEKEVLNKQDIEDIKKKFSN